MRPVYEIKADGVDVTRIIRERFVSLTVTDDEGRKSDEMTLVLDDREGSIATPSKDVVLSVSMGYDGQPLQPMGKFHGLGVGFSFGSGGRLMTITGSAVNLRQGMKSPKTRDWNGKTLGDIADTIAGEQGYAAVVDPSLAFVMFESIAQTGETDWQFLNRIVTRRAGFVRVSGGNIVIGKRDGSKTSVATKLALPETVADVGVNVLGYNLKRDDKTRYKSVTVKWRDAATGETKSYTAGSGNPNREVLELADDEVDAKQHAAAELARLNRVEAAGTVDLVGTPKAIALAGLTIKNARDDVDGDYVITRVTHTINSSGFSTRCDVEL